MSTVWKHGDSRALGIDVVPGSLRRGLPVRHDHLTGLSPIFHTVLILLTSTNVEKRQRFHYWLSKGRRGTPASPGG